MIRAGRDSVTFVGSTPAPTPARRVLVLTAPDDETTVEQVVDLRSPAKKKPRAALSEITEREARARTGMPRSAPPKPREQSPPLRSDPLRRAAEAAARRASPPPPAPDTANDAAIARELAGSPPGRPREDTSNDAALAASLAGPRRPRPLGADASERRVAKTGRVDARTMFRVVAAAS